MIYHVQLKNSSLIVLLVLAKSIFWGSIALNMTNLKIRHITSNIDSRTRDIDNWNMESQIWHLEIREAYTWKRRAPKTTPRRWCPNIVPLWGIVMIVLVVSMISYCVKVMANVSWLWGASLRPHSHEPLTMSHRPDPWGRSSYSPLVWPISMFTRNPNH